MITKINDKEFVTCETCGALILKNFARVVKVEYGYNSINDDLFFCLQHRPKYDKVIRYDYGIESKYYIQMVCDEKGVPFGYKKVEPKPLKNVKP